MEIEEVGKITMQPEANAAIQITSIAWLNERLNRILASVHLDSTTLQIN
ncbi:conserved hypothetical protein [Alteromonas macleodii]